MTAAVKTRPNEAALSDRLHEHIKEKVRHRLRLMRKAEDKAKAKP